MCVCVTHPSFGNAFCWERVGVVAGLLVGRSDFYVGVEGGVRKYSLGVINVVVLWKFGVDVEFFYGTKV